MFSPGISQKSHTIARKTPKNTKTLKMALQNHQANYIQSDADKKLIIRHLNSPSASLRFRAISAIKNPVKSRYSFFDVPSEEQDITSQEREMEKKRPKTVNEVMKDVIAYVEVRNADGLDCTAGVKAKLRALGAIVNDTFLKDTTIVIFKGGRAATYNRAKQLDIPMVAVGWIEGVMKHLVLCDPKDYKISNLGWYENPEIHGPVRRVKGLPQPKNTSKEIDPLAATKPLVFRTPIANSLKQEWLDQQKKCKAADVEEKTVIPEETTPIAPPPKPKCFTAPLPPIKKTINAHIIKKAMQTVKDLKDSPNKTLTSNIIDLTISPKIEKISNIVQTMPKANRRRTLFTPNIDYETVQVTTNKRKTAIFTPQTPSTPTTNTNCKSAIKRRTLFTPSYDTLQTPKLSAQTLKTPIREKRSVSRRRTVMNPLPDTPRPNFVFGIKTLAPVIAKLTPATPKTVIKKKTDVENFSGFKENTPPRKKSNLTSNKSFEKPIVIHVDLKTPEIVPSHRRRTLFMANNKFAI